MDTHDLRVRLIGGLGNQLFQFYAGLYLSKALQKNLCLDFRWIEGNYGHPDSDLRDFELGKGIRHITNSSDGSLDFKIERIRTVVAREIPFVGRKLGLQVPKDSGLTQLVPQSRNIEVRGYFQTNEYFSRISKLKSPLTLVTQSTEFLECHDFLSQQPFLAIHIRGGDYLAKKNFYHILNKKYYETAITHALSNSNLERLVVFSDDKDYARKLIGSRFKLEFLPDLRLRASEDMELMSLASSFVIANSTFSYWAAMRSDSNDIFAPEKWFTKREMSRNFYPSTWNIITVD